MSYGVSFVYSVTRRSSKTTYSGPFCSQSLYLVMQNRLKMSRIFQCKLLFSWKLQAWYFLPSLLSVHCFRINDMGGRKWVHLNLSWLFVNNAWQNAPLDMVESSFLSRTGLAEISELQTVCLHPSSTLHCWCTQYLLAHLRNAYIIDLYVLCLFSKNLAYK